jgi:transcription elongation factor Elf1
MNDKVWYVCPICNQKLLMINPVKSIEGVYVKCKKCHQEVEVINKKSA